MTWGPMRSGLAILTTVSAILGAQPSADAMGKRPPDIVAEQLAGYRQVLTAYFKSFNLLPILLPAGQKPGDVFDMRQHGVLVATAQDCFPTLTSPTPAVSALAYTFHLDSTKGGLALGLPSLGSFNLGAGFDDTITVQYTQVKATQVSQKALTAALSPSCSDVASVVNQSEVSFGSGSPPSLLAIIGLIVTAKRQVFIGANNNVDLSVSVNKLGTVLASVGLGSLLKVSGLDPNMSAALGFGSKSGVLVQSDEELPVAFMPAFIPEVIFSIPMGATADVPRPRSLRWQSFDPSSAEASHKFNVLVDAANGP